MNSRKVGIFPIPALLVLIVVLYVTVNPSTFFDPAWLIPITNTLFITITCIAVAFIAMRNYRSTGRIQILLLGCGVLIFGIGSFIAGFTRSLPDGANLTVTIHNTGAFIGALFHLIAALILILGISPEIGSKHKGLFLASSYLGIIVFMILLTLASLNGMTPPFFIQGQGPTPLRQIVLGFADFLFAFSFVIFASVYGRNKEVFLYWYSLALALTSIGLTAVFIQHSLGSPVGWAGRFSQYLGGIYFFIALITAARSAEARKTSFENIITSSLSPAEEKFRALAEHSPDIIARFDKALKHIYVNPEGLRMLGKPADAVIGKTAQETGAPELYRHLWKEGIEKVLESGQAIAVADYIPTENGKRFYHSNCVPEYGVDGLVSNVLVVSRDLTERKKTEETLRTSEERYRSILENIQDGYIRANDKGIVTMVSPSAVHMYGIDSFPEMIGIPALSLYKKPEDRNRLLEELKNHGKVTDFECEALRKDGLSVHVSLNAQYHYDAQGQIQGTEAFVRDITERKKAVEILRRQADLLRLSYDAIIVWQMNGVIESWNCGAEQLYGFTENEVLGKVTHKLLATVHPEPWAQIKIELREKGVWEGELRHYTKDGREVIVSARKQLIHGDDGVDRVLEINRNITENKRAEEALRQSEERHRMLFETMTEGFALHEIVTDDKGQPCDYRFLDVNPAFERQTGLKKINLIGKRIREVMPGIESHWIENYGKVVLTGEPLHMENYASDLKRWYSVFSYRPEPGRFAVIFSDITDRRKAEEALRESEVRLRRFYESSLIGVIYWNMDGVISDANDKFLQMVGYTREELVAGGIDWINMTPPEYRHLDEQSAKELKATGVNKKPFEKEYIRKDGTRLPIIVAGAMLDEVRFNGVAFVLDITERKKAEADVSKMSEDMAIRNRELEFMNKELESFIYSVSHDLRAPIRTMAGFAKFLMDDYPNELDDQGKHYLSRIQAGSEKMIRLVEDLLKLSRISRQEISLAEIDLSSQASSVIAELRQTNPGRNVEVDIQSDIKASADPRLIEVALSNILGNAWKFTSKTEKAHIEFRSVEKNGKTVYFVKDNGAGFDQTYTDKMFQPFHRLHTETEFEGTGIGLAIVERVIHRHNGTIWAEGEPGKGATIYFTLGDN